MHEHAFIIRCWDEAFEPQLAPRAPSASHQSGEDDSRQQEVWRYRIVHVATRREAVFNTLDEITGFIAAALSDAF